MCAYRSLFYHEIETHEKKHRANLNERVRTKARYWEIPINIDNLNSSDDEKNLEKNTRQIDSRVVYAKQSMYLC